MGANPRPIELSSDGENITEAECRLKRPAPAPSDEEEASPSVTSADEAACEKTSAKPSLCSAARFIEAINVRTVVQQIVPYLLDDTSKSVYFEGWDALGASAVFRAIAEHPPPSLLEKFDKIICIDQTRWTSRRALQRAIVDEIKLTQQLAADFDRQDEEDDFKGIDQASRDVIAGVATAIARSLAQFRCLILFQNGSDRMVDLNSCGIPPPELFNTKVLWNFRGRLRLTRDGGLWNTACNSASLIVDVSPCKLNEWLEEEAREIALYAQKLGHGVTPEIATECCLYLLSLDYRGGDVIDFNWAIHASNYWVCDGIVQGGQDNQAWELAHALQQQMRLEVFSFETNSRYRHEYDISAKHCVFITDSYSEEVPSGTTSLFFAPPLKSRRYVSFPSKRFHEADQLRVLKLCRCTFSFSSPPFHCCRNLRFLGLDGCKDEQQLGEEEDKTGARAVETFQRLWVLDVSDTDWALDFPLETEEAVVMVATNIREVHVKKGSIWRNNIAWRRLPNLRKLRVVDPTSSWETGRQDEFMDMVKLELLDLSGNSTMKVLPSLSGATGLKTLILDGCVGLEHVGPQGLPPSLESFCFNSRLGYDEKKAKISRISLAGCARLADFRLGGAFRNLKELDLSHTAVKMLDLKGNEVMVGSPQRVFLVGCEQLRSISWPCCRESILYSIYWPYTYSRECHPVKLLCIDTRAGGEVARKPTSFDSFTVSQGESEEDEYYGSHAFVTFTDMRFLQSVIEILRGTPNVKMNLYWSSASEDDGRSCHSKKIGGQVAGGGSPLPRSLTYEDISTEHQITGSSSTVTTPFQEPLGIHMEIGDGVSDVPNTVSQEGIRVICNVMDMVRSLHVHDSSFITAVIPGHIVVSQSDDRGAMNDLRWCRVERCPRLQTVFNTKYKGFNFYKLETLWAAHLLMVRSIWQNSPRTPTGQMAYRSFGNLRAIHLHFCPRLRHVLELSWNDDLSQLEALHILYCGELRQVFAVEQQRIQEEIAASPEESWLQWKPTKGMLEFNKLKHLYLQELPNLQLICQAKMFAPNLETIHLRGCWSIRRLPATDSSRRREDGRPVAVDCEKECWDKLEWDGSMESGHHPSLFQPRHSKYYRERHLRPTVLR